MHGYIARWLRIMGYDTIYVNNFEDRDAFKFASEGRILVTSDVELARYAGARGIEVVVIKGMSEEEALRIIIRRFNLAIREDCLRCTACNGELETISPEEALRTLGFIPRGVETFWRCKACSKLYWKGSHWRSISRQLSRLMAEKSAAGSV
jgi:uncharacterized protein with PIN domain